MASCQFYRLCSDDTTGNAKFIGKLSYDSVNRDILCMWSETRGALSPRILQFARFNIDTLSPHAEVTVTGDGSSTQVGRAPTMLVMPGDSARYVAVFSHAATAKVATSESSDSGATWGAVTDPTGSGNSVPEGFASDGTALHLISTWPSVATGDVEHRVRTGVQTYGSTTKIYDGTPSGTPGPWDSLQETQAHSSVQMLDTSTGLYVGFRCLDTETVANGLKRVTALYTTDGWATATPVDIDTTSGNALLGAIHSVVDSTGRVYVLWHDPDDHKKPVLAYTEDWGVNWTLLGTPAIVSSTMTDLGLTDCDETYDSYLCVDEQDNILFGFSTENNLTPDFHLVFRGKTVANNYVLAESCGYGQPDHQIATNTTGHAIVVEGDIYRCISKVLDSGTGTQRGALYFIVIEGAAVPEEPEEPPITPESRESGVDDNNMLLRTDMEEGRGWSMHTIPVACFLPWDEGDRETGREVPILLAGSPSMSPEIQDPELIPGFFRIEQEMNYGRRIYVADSETTTQVRQDPYRVYIRSKEYTIAGDFDVNVVRAALLTYTYDAPAGETFPMMVWIDGKLNRTIEVPTTYGLQETRFFPLPTFNNVGNKIQLVIDKNNLFPLFVDAWGIKYIRKQIRG